MCKGKEKEGDLSKSKFTLCAKILIYSRLMVIYVNEDYHSQNYGIRLFYQHLKRSLFISTIGNNTKNNALKIFAFANKNLLNTFNISKGKMTLILL